MQLDQQYATSNHTDWDLLVVETILIRMRKTCI